MAEAARAGAWTVEKGGVAIWLRLTPKGGRDAIEGVETLSDGRAVVKARVRAAPQDGLANAAATKLLARALDIRESAIEIVSGQTGRVKKFFVAGEPAEIVAALTRWVIPQTREKDGG